MAFLKRQKTLEERKAAVADKLAALRKEVARKEAALAEAKDTLAKALGNLAMETTPANEDAVKHGRKAVERTAEGLDDARIMVTALEKEVARVQVETLEAVVRETPARMEEAAKGFNELLGAALEAVRMLRELHDKMWAAQRTFAQYRQERDAALLELKRQEPLVLTVGFGALAADTIPATHRYTVQVPEPRLLDRLVAELLAYESKLVGYGDGKGMTADWAMQDMAGVGSVGTIGEAAGKLQVGFDARDHV